MIGALVGANCITKSPKVVFIVTWGTGMNWVETKGVASPVRLKFNVILPVAIGVQEITLCVLVPPAAMVGLPQPAEVRLKPRSSAVPTTVKLTRRLNISRSGVTLVIRAGVFASEAGGPLLLLSLPPPPQAVNMVARQIPAVVKYLFK